MLYNNESRANKINSMTFEFIEFYNFLTYKYFYFNIFNKFLFNNLFVELIKVLIPYQKTVWIIGRCSYFLYHRAGFLDLLNLKADRRNF